MAKINDTTTFPNTAPALTDHVPGTDVSNVTNDANGETVTFSFQGIMDLMEANMTVPTSVSSAYLTSTILASTSNGEGAALLGVEDAGTYFAGANVEAVLAEIGALLPAEANATADQSDAEIETAYNNQVAVIGQAEAEAGVATTVRRFTAERIGQAIAALAATDNFDEGAGAPASAPSAVNRFYRDTSGGDLYYSIGTSTTADWILLFSATGGSLLSELTDTDAVTTSDHALFGDATASGASKSRTYANLISDLALALTSGNAYTGTHDFGGADDLEIPNGATPTIAAAGQIAIDTTVTDWSHGILEYFSGEAMGVVAMPIAQFTSPTGGYVVAYNATNDEFELVAQAGGGDMSASTYDPATIAEQLVGLTATQTLTNKTLTDPKVSHSYNAQTGTTYTLVLADANKVVSMSNASANTLTIPTNASVAYPTGTIITVFALGAGTTTIAGDTGVTLSGNGGSGSAYSADIQTQYGAATLIKIGSDSWLISGDIDTVAA